MRKKKLFGIRYNESNDSFELWTKVGDDEIGVPYSYFCQKREGDEKADFVHFTILNKMKELSALGYSFVSWE